MSDISPAIVHARQHHARFLDQLKDLLRIPSVSALPEHSADMRRAAEAVATDLKAVGLENVRVIPVEKHPLVYGDWLHAPDKPTVLCYGHYDVQPAALENGWDTPPFEPVERSGNLYARGATDDKGQMMTHTKALESLLAATGKLPVNVRVLIEGGEESGGEDIDRFLHDHPDQLACDVVLISDTEMFAPGLPSLTVGLRGICYTEIEARGPRADLHSGSFGGVAPNPLFAMSQIIAALKDDTGRILIPGFYDRVKPPSNAELAAWSSLPFDAERYRQNEVGASALTGEAEYSIQYRLWARPTLEVHGIPGGFTGSGAKTVIPARAGAKISMRLVPDQDPQEIYRLFEEHVLAMAPKGITVEVKALGLAQPVVVSTDSPYVKTAAAAMKEVFGRDTVFVRSGGSIPIVSAFAEILRAPSLLAGFGLPDDGAHGPNEKINLANFYAGIETIIRFLERLGEA